MSRRVSLPKADDLFRPTAVEAPAPGRATAAEGSAAPAPEADAESEAETGSRRRPSGRIRHDEKMTVYVTSQELLDIEQARLLLRAQHGLAIDRGRLVREALAMALADLEAQGEESLLVSRLRDS